MAPEDEKAVVAFNTVPGLTESIAIDDLRGFSPSHSFVRSLYVAGEFRVSIVTSMEAVQGCRNSTDLRHMLEYLAQATVVPLSGEIAEGGLELMRTFTLSHGLTIPDALIAATALEHGLTLYTRNARHFQMVPGLIVVRPY